MRLTAHLCSAAISGYTQYLRDSFTRGWKYIKTSDPSCLSVCPSRMYHPLDWKKKKAKKAEERQKGREERERNQSSEVGRITS